MNKAHTVVLHENNVVFTVDGTFPFGKYTVMPIITELHALVGEHGRVVSIVANLSNGMKKYITHRGNFTIIR